MKKSVLVTGVFLIACLVTTVGTQRLKDLRNNPVGPVVTENSAAPHISDQVNSLAELLEAKSPKMSGPLTTEEKRTAKNGVVIRHYPNTDLIFHRPDPNVFYAPTVTHGVNLTVEYDAKTGQVISLFDP